MLGYSVLSAHVLCWLKRCFKLKPWGQNEKALLWQRSGASQSFSSAAQNPFQPEMKSKLYQITKGGERQQLKKSAGLHQLWDAPSARGLLDRLQEGWPMGQLGLGPQNPREPRWEKNLEHYFHQDIEMWMTKSMSLLHSIYTHHPPRAA